jgi:hypothetical protein
MSRHYFFAVGEYIIGQPAKTRRVDLPCPVRPIPKGAFRRPGHGITSMFRAYFPPNGRRPAGLSGRYHRAAIDIKFIGVRRAGPKLTVGRSDDPERGWRHSGQSR